MRSRDFGVEGNTDELDGIKSKYTDIIVTSVLNLKKEKKIQGVIQIASYSATAGAVIQMVREPYRSRSAS